MATKKVLKKSTAKKAAPKKTVSKKTVTKKVAVKTSPIKKKIVSKKKTATAKAPAPAPKMPSKKVTKPAEKKSSARSETVIIADIDVGFGNDLYIRGNGAGLNWNEGKKMNFDPNNNQWFWKSDNADNIFEYKLLLNNEIWDTGENIITVPGQKSVSKPSFKY